MSLMATHAASDPLLARSRPLVLSYWVMPLAAGFLVTATAGGMLIETLVLANSIDSSVTPITRSLADIKLHTDTIAALNQVDASAKGIRTASAPLAGQAGGILNTVAAIRSSVGSIDISTGSIDRSAAEIDASVAVIQAQFRTIAGSAESVEGKLSTTISLTDQVLTVLAGVRGDTAGLLVAPFLPTINDHADSIDCKLGPGGACQ
jgi:hypothetical protein